MENFDDHELSLKQKIYSVYLAVFELPEKTQKKTMIMTPLLGGYESSWRVIGITEAALEMLAENNYKYRKNSICRAHIVGRYETAKQLFECKSPLSIESFFQIVWVNDRTVISTKSENKTNGILPKVIPLDYKMKLFTCNPLVGFRYSKIERNFLKELHIDYKNGIVNLISPYDNMAI